MWWTRQCRCWAWLPNTWSGRSTRSYWAYSTELCSALRARCGPSREHPTRMVCLMFAGHSLLVALQVLAGTLQEAGLDCRHCAMIRNIHGCLQAIIRAVCAIIDAFHFATEVPEEAAGAASPAEVVPQSSLQVPKDAAYVADIQKALAKRVLPALQKQLVGHLGHTTNGHADTHFLSLTIDVWHPPFLAWTKWL